MKNPSKIEIVSHFVSTTLAGQRIDIGLTTCGLISTRSQARKAIESEKALINGKPVKPSYKLQEGDTIEVEVEKPADIEIVPYEFELDIVFEDQDVIVINKPAGLVVHPAAGHREDTLINALMAYNTKLSQTGESFRPGLVHRLDKNTSGLLVLAKNDEAHSFLAKQFLKKTTHRRYWAICFSGPLHDQGTISSYICRDPKNRKKFSVSEEQKGKHAVTHYKVLKRNSHFSLLELSLETGRTHQIRVHLSNQGFPIVGDDTYHGKKRSKNLKSLALRKLILDMERFALHAKELGFVHPTSKQKMMFNSDVADDLGELFELCGFS